MKSFYLFYIKLCVLGNRKNKQDAAFLHIAYNIKPMNITNKVATKTFGPLDGSVVIKRDCKISPHQLSSI